MSDLEGYGKIYESTYWGDGRDNTIDWGIVYKNLGVSTDADYQAVLNKGTAEGYTLPSASQQELQNTLVTSLKANSNVWDKLDMLFVFANNGSEEYSLIDWKNPTGTLGTASTDIVWVNTDTDVATSGFTADGVDDYIDTGHLAGTTGSNFTTISASMGVYSTTEYSTATGNDYPITSDISTQRIRFFETSQGGNRFLTTSNYVGAMVSGSSQRGMMGIQKTASGTLQALRGDKSLGATQGGLTDAAPTTDAAKTVKIFRYLTVYGEGNIKLAWVGSKFTETEWDEYVTAVDTYIAAL
jgi:hypothetical protein